MKPIEEGCLALVVNGHPKNIGKTVTVGKHLGQPEDTQSDYGDWWEISDLLILFKEVQSEFMSGYEEVKVRMYPEAGLMCIDGYEESKQEEKKDELLHIF